MDYCLIFPLALLHSCLIFSVTIASPLNNGNMDPIPTPVFPTLPYLVLLPRHCQINTTSSAAQQLTKRALTLTYAFSHKDAFVLLPSPGAR